VDFASDNSIGGMAVSIPAWIQTEVRQPYARPTPAAIPFEIRVNLTAKEESLPLGGRLLFLCLRPGGDLPETIQLSSGEPMQYVTCITVWIAGNVL